MNLNKQLLELLLSQDEEDCRLGFEICKRKGIKPITLNKLDNIVINDERYTYDNCPFMELVSEYLTCEDIKGNNKYGYRIAYAMWREEEDDAK